MELEYLVLPELQHVGIEQSRKGLKSMLRVVRNSLRSKIPLNVTFFPILYFPPALFPIILVEVRGLFSQKMPEFVHINGTRVTLQEVSQFGHDGYIVSDPRYFCHWENILVFRKPFKAKNVFIYPCARHGEIERIMADDLFEFGERTEIKSLGDLKKINVRQRCRRKNFVYSYRNNPEDAINDSISFLLHSLNVDPHSSFRGSLYAAFDLEYHGFRLASWLWPTAIAINALLGELSLRTSTSNLCPFIDTLKNTLLDLQIKEGQHQGGYPVRWDIDPYVTHGIIPWVAPNDSAFIGSNALLPLYRYFKDEQCLRAARCLANWIIQEGTQENGLVYVGYNPNKNCWDKTWLYVDCAFTVPLFEALYDIDKNHTYQKWVDRFLEVFIDSFRLSDGLFLAILRHGKSYSKHIFTRGQAWVLDGLISGYRMLGKDKYLQCALNIVKVLGREQNKNGSWYYNHLRPSSGEDGKAIPVLAYHLLQLYEITNDVWLVDVAVCALRWCMAHQITMNQSLAGGGIGSYTIEGAIAGRKNAVMIFSYSVSYFILAIRKLEKLGFLNQL